MGYLNVIYRALSDYRKNTHDNKDCAVQRSAIKTSNSESDVIEITRRTCKVEDDWISAIEKGLKFIEKAINEERQFIRSNGEIVPIEKVKRVSKDSVEHLARHSNLLTHVPEEEDGDLIPDNLYMVERLSDFAVYENRFLYMLLCNLRDFISIRYERIVEVTNTYNGRMTMNKSVVESNRKVEYTVNLVEEKKKDEYLKEHNVCQSEIDRMLVIYKAVTFFLNTPLMNRVAKAPMLKPPVTRTNVLRMNRNFREALSLYEYISAYDKDGYEIITEVKTVSPFTSTLAEEIAETVELSSFLTYQYGLGIREYFKREFEREEIKRKDEQQQKLAEQLKNAKRHLNSGEMSPEEYVMMLEKRISDLEGRENELLTLRGTVDELYTESEKLKFELRYSKEKILSLEEEKANLIHKHEEEMQEEKERHIQEMTATVKAHELEVLSLNREHAEELEHLTAKYENEIDNINSQHAQEVDKLNGEIEKTKLDCAEEIRVKDEFVKGEIERFQLELDDERKKLEQDKLKIAEYEKKYNDLADAKALSDGRLMAMRSEYNLIRPDEDFTTKEMVDELEHQYEVFKKFFKGEWSKTKKRIRKEVFKQVKDKEKEKDIKAKK